MKTGEEAREIQGFCDELAEILERSGHDIGLVYRNEDEEVVVIRDTERSVSRINCNMSSVKGAVVDIIKGLARIL